ncbi:MAG TPA: CinA family nicotinamide mononucleotide deamidase-related protein [Thermoanaerobaculia bacterium]|nr:CinA family nicotinamide mononucleotide deamidase-related protein [Thermoanaerobaculia bacterium]HUM30818.1 CinA family nicotinamide mononucleotide deamidase-related protein [Thermoanaerobaculia bacterium]HXK69153.1 CinA family nicotinamide mononucleotide deamidase-related protein [Thermoanaerobaculia bacterium]
MRAAIVIVGSEMLTPWKQDTNSLYLTEVLNQHGVEVTTKIILGDEEDELSAALAFLAKHNELILLSGGLGPTRDDVTREATACFLKVPLIHFPELLMEIQAFFAARGRDFPEIAKKQSMIPEGAEPLHNQAGTAPGFVYQGKTFSIWAFPGVPQELRHMVQASLIPALKKLALPAVHTLHMALSGKPESECELILEPYYRKYGRDGFTILSGGGKIELIVKTTDPDTLRERKELLSELFSDDLYTDRGETMEAVVIRLLIERRETLAVAESCTGGLLAKRLTDVPGASAVFMGGMVAYDNSIKIEQLSIPPSLIEKHGAVSQAVAEEMARSARTTFSSHYGIGITGIAGPTGYTEDKPLGTVHIAVSARDQTIHRKFRFPGDRDRVRTFAVQSSLDMLRRILT